MKKEELKQLKEKNLKDLEEELKKLEKELFQLKMDKITGKLKNLKSIFFKRKTLAILKTMIKEKEII